MNAIHAQAQLSSIVQERPWLVRCFRAMGIDAQRSGNQSLQAVCAAAGLKVGEVVSTLSRFGQGPPDLQALSLTQLTEYIAAWHHRYLRQALPGLTRQVDSLVCQQGSIYPELAHLKVELGRFVAEVYTQLFREEQVVFSCIRDLEGDRSDPELAASVERWISRTLEDHEAALQRFMAIRQLTRNYTAPAGAGKNLQTLIQGLAELDEDMRWHMYAENDVLFPRALSVTQAA